MRQLEPMVGIVSLDGGIRALLGRSLHSDRGESDMVLFTCSIEDRLSYDSIFGRCI